MLASPRGAVTRNVNRHRPVITLQHLARDPIAPVGLLLGRFAVGVIAQMLGQFSAQHPLHQPDLQLLHQAFQSPGKRSPGSFPDPAHTQQIFGAFNAAKQLVQYFLGNRHCRHAPSVWKHGPNYSYTEDRTVSEGPAGPPNLILRCRTANWPSPCAGIIPNACEFTTKASHLIYCPSMANNPTLTNSRSHLKLLYLQCVNYLFTKFHCPLK